MLAVAELKALSNEKKGKTGGFLPSSEAIENIMYKAVAVGFLFFTIATILGALWAADAWGSYWSWDPKETWAAITWLAYLIYVHYRLMPKHCKPVALATLIVAFVLLQVCWWGINYLPSAQGSSVHTYSTESIR